MCRFFVQLALYLLAPVAAPANHYLSFLTSLHHSNSKDQDGIIVPQSESDSVDKFIYGRKEYLVVDRKTNSIMAGVLCKRDYGGHLAVLDNMQVSEFMAEALSETNLKLDALWVAGAKLNNKWCWVRDNNSKPISKEIQRLMVVNTKVNAHDRNCLTFARLDHDRPQFRPLRCTVQRAVMCERPAGGGGYDNGTHPGWIRLGERLYKIFREPIYFDEGDKKCFHHDIHAKLAVVTTFEHAQYLGRYLLIGRPSLENAWIGARWTNQSAFVFEEENLVLRNKTDQTGYPPWRYRRLQTAMGCLLLDRHLANTTLFVEARCRRLRPYICYKMGGKNYTDYWDVIIGKHGYRLFFNRLYWEQARDVCNISYARYEGKLAEIREAKQKADLLYVMGENKTNVEHIWLGGIYQVTENGWQWLWDSDKSPIDMRFLNMVHNQTFEYDLEFGNSCLNMDRENHLVALHYGTFCHYVQRFVCSFPADKLRQLERDEIANRTNT